MNQPISNVLQDEKTLYKQETLRLYLSFKKLRPLPSDNVRLDDVTVITDCEKFVSESLKKIYANPNKSSKPYLERLLRLERLLTNEKNQNG